MTENFAEFPTIYNFAPAKTNSQSFKLDIMATTADFKNGLYLNFNGKPCSIVWFQHVKPGKGPAFVKTKLRNLENGRILENTFTAGAKIETITRKIMEDDDEENDLSFGGSGIPYMPGWQGSELGPEIQIRR